MTALMSAAVKDWEAGARLLIEAGVAADEHVIGVAGGAVLAVLREHRAKLSPEC